MAFSMMNIAPLPKHDTYAGALWGGAKQAVENVAGIVGHAAGPETSSCQGARPRTIRQRLSELSFIPTSVSMAFDAHTKSFTDPKGFAETNAAIARFQQGRSHH